jgi:signal transduction histidine kinase
MRLWRLLLSLISKVGVLPDDDEETRLRKAILVGTTIMVSVAAFLWGMTYLFFNEPLAATIPLFYALFSTFYLVAFGMSRNFEFFRLAQFSLSLVLPFLLMLALGGYINGSAVILWAFIAPLGAILGGQWRQATYWFLGYVVLLVIAGLLQPYLRAANNLPFEVIIAFFVVNLAAVSSIALAVLVYFVKQKDLSLELMRKNRELEQSYLQQEIMLRQSEKLATLGKLSAGMAHELNNPAAAAQRGAEQLRGEIAQLREVQFELGALGLSASQREALTARARLAEERARHPLHLDPLTRSDREYEIEARLEDSGVHDAWEAAPLLVDMGYEPDAVAELGKSFSPEQLPKLVVSQSSLYATHSLLEEIGQGAGRIVKIVVQKHRGEIDVRSQPGATCFEVRLPIDFERIEEASERQAA